MENLLPLMALLGDEREQKIAKRTRRTHSAVFKSKVALAAIKRWLNWHSGLTYIPIRLQGGNGNSARERPRSLAVEPPVDLKALHAKIGQLTLENDFLEEARIKVGWLSATR